MPHFTKLFFLLLLLLLTVDLSAQSSCGTEEPFLLPPTSTFCADTSGRVTINFKIYNNGAPGTYKVAFPDGSDTIYTNVINTAEVIRTFDFDCGMPMGEPISPTPDALFFEYQNALIITREDCVDERGDNQRGSYDFRVVPNPIVDVKHTKTQCIEDPFEVTFEGKMCSDRLVDSYQWYVNDTLVAGATTKKLNKHPFLTPGEHVVRLEVTTFKGCEKYAYEKIIDIQPKPVINLGFDIDSTQLCEETIEVETNTTYRYTTKWQWSSPSGGVSFSDPTAPNPTITINNNKAGRRTIIVSASNPFCSAARDTFYVDTERGQTIREREEIVTCDGYELDLGRKLSYTPRPDDITWTTLQEGVTIVNPNSTNPKLTFDAIGSYTLTASGLDACGESYSIPVQVRVRDGSELQIDISSVDTICSTVAPFDLLDFITPLGNVRSITGKGIVNNVFDPSVNEGNTKIMVTDSCGTEYPLAIFVIPQERYEGNNIEICQGDFVDLYALQAGEYRGTGVKNNFFESADLDIGSYTVLFESLTFCGGTDSLTVRVQEYPKAEFVIVTDSCGGPDSFKAGNVYAGIDPINVENRSSARTLCYEVLETGQKSCNREKARFVFDEPGVYTIQQVVAFPGGQCTDTISQQLKVLFPPRMNFYADMDSSVCDSLTIAFSLGDHPADWRYDWSFGEEEKSKQAEPLLKIIRPLAAEVLDVNVGVTNACYTTQDSFGVVLPLRFRVSFDILNDNNTVCSDDTIFLSNTSVNAFDFRVTYPDGRQTTQLPRKLTIQNTGKDVLRYPITLEGSNVSCPDESIVDTIYVLPITTEAAFGLNYDDVCSSAEIQLDNSSTPGALTFVNWGDGSTPQLIDDLERLTHTYDVDRDSTFHISLTAKLCGLDTFHHSVTVRPSPESSFEVVAAEVNCVDKPMIFIPTSGSNAYGISWDFGDGNQSHDEEVQHAFAAAGSYTVSMEVSSKNGCTATDSTVVEIGSYSGAPLDFTMPRSVCARSPFDLQITSPATGWDIDYGNGMVSNQPLEAPYHEEGTYRMVMTATSENGCSIDSSTFVKVAAGFTAEIQTTDLDTLVGLGDELDLSVHISPPRNIRELLWTGDSIVNPNSPYTSALPLDDGFYGVSLVDADGCVASDSIRVRVEKDYRSRIYAPNVFSPNGDGFNEFFALDVKDNTVRSIRSLKIISRIGALVYACEDCEAGAVNSGWDGRLGDQPLESNVYIWAAEVDFVDGTSQLFTGDVTLLR